jgi:hypothetical protein
MHCCIETESFWLEWEREDRECVFVRVNALTWVKRKLYQYGSHSTWQAEAQRVRGPKNAASREPSFQKPGGGPRDLGTPGFSAEFCIFLIPLRTPIAAVG